MTRSIHGGLLVLALSLPIAAGEPADQNLVRFARHGADVWARNPVALISGEGKACVSCHTSLPYALVEPLLPGSYPAYEDLIENIDQRILSWDENTPWYAEDKVEKTAIVGGLPPDALKGILSAEDSRGVETIFNALIRATHDAFAGTAASEQTRRAFEILWAEQIPAGPAAGRWNWLRVNLLPWEVGDSDLWGASLACVAASIFPDLAQEENVRLLYATLKKAFADDAVSLHVKASILWCDAESEFQMLDPEAAARLTADLLALQHASGGWALRELGPWADWEGSDADCCAKRDIRPDAYATGFVALALARRSPLLSTEQQTRLASAMGWIERELANPYPDGPRFNKHLSADAELPEFRDNLYTNAGHMWSFLAKTVYRRQGPPWGNHEEAPLRGRLLRP